MTVGTDLDAQLAALAANQNALAKTIVDLDARVKRLETAASTTPPPVVVDPPPVVDPPVVTLPPPSGQFLNVRSKALMPSIATMPALGASVKDTRTGAIVRRVANGLIDYGRFTRTSVDDKYLLVHFEDSHSAEVRDRATGALVRSLPTIGEVNELRWNYGAGGTPLLFFVRGMTFNSLDVVTGKETLLRDFKADFPNADFIGTDVEGDSSNDSNRWAWMAWKRDGNGDYPLAIFAYERGTNKILATMTAADLTAGNTDKAHVPAWPMGKPNMVEMTPDGSRVLIHWNRAWISGTEQVNGNLVGTHQDAPHAYEISGGKLVTWTAVKMANDATHSAWAKLDDGTDVLVSQDSQTDYIIAASVVGGYANAMKIMSHADIGWNNGMHFAKSYVRKGQVLMSTSSPANKVWGENQLFFVDLKPYVAATTLPVRIGPTNNAYPGIGEAYRNEGTASLNYAGNRAYLTANWMSAQRSVYEVQL